MKKTRALFPCPGLAFCLVFAAAWPGTCAEPFQPNPVAALPTPAPPKHGAVNIEFTGASKFHEGDLRSAIADQIQDASESGLNAASADDAAFFLMLFYHKNGYSQAEVKPQIAGSDRLVLKISEGALTEIGGVTFHGGKSFSDATLHEYLIGATRERFSRLKKSVPFVEADLLGGIQRIRGFYESEGFPDTAIEAPEVTFSPDKKSAFIAVKINEGARYTFGTPEFDGDVVFYPEKTQMLPTLAPFLEKPFTRFQVTNMQRALVYLYKQRGYFDPKITVESDPGDAKNGVVPVRFHIAAGEVYRFDGMEIEGLDRLRRSFLEHRFGSLSGKFYNPDKLDAAFHDTMRTGLFKKLRVDPRPLPDKTIRLHLEVEEAKARELGVSIGYGTFEGAILGFHAADRDLFGSGRPLSATVEVSQRLLKGEVLYEDPWFLESAYRLRVRAFGLTEDFDGYSKLESGLRVELSRDLTKQFNVTAFLLGHAVSITNTGIDPGEIGPSSYQASSIGLSETLDFRKGALNPERGWIATATQDYTGPLIGSLDFLRATGRFSYYLPIKKTLLAFGARAGVILPLAGHEAIPIDERFFNGGARSVRSFAERELGPKDKHNYPVGGETFSQFNLEYVFPIWGDLEAAAFADAGSVGRTNGLGDMRFGIGGGLRYKLPIGPLRLDYGINPARRADEAMGAFHFSFGAAF